MRYFLILFFFTIKVFSQNDTIYSIKYEKLKSGIDKEYYLLSKDGKKVMVRSKNKQGGIISEIYFYNKVKNGTCNIFWDNGNLKEISHWVEDLQNGESKFFYETGAIKQIMNFCEGELDGEIIEFYKNGKVKYEGFFIKGKKSGNWNSYLETGKNQKTISFD